MTVTVVVAPHPDDEVLGCSAVLPEATAVVHVTDGVPDFLSFDDVARQHQAAVRAAETQLAWCELGATPQLVRLDHGDGTMVDHVDELASTLVDLVRTLDADRVLVPAYQGGHPDHDASFVAAALAAHSTVGVQWQVYACYGLDDGGAVRFGWLDPSHHHARLVPLTPSAHARKAAALRCYRSQIGPATVLGRWLRCPAGECFADLPSWGRLPAVRAYYDEILDFSRYGLSEGTVVGRLAALYEADAGATSRSEGAR